MSILNQVLYFKHFQSFLLKYNLIKILTKFKMLKYLLKNLKFFILIKIKNQNFVLKNLN